MEISVYTATLCLMSSFCVGIATYQFIRGVLDDLLLRDGLDEDEWQRQQVRWQILRSQSAIFRVFERWIRVLSLFIERYVGGLLVPKGESPKFQSKFRKTFSLLFGSAEDVERATRIRVHDQPWSSSEVFATGGLLGILSSASIAVVLKNDLNTSFLIVCSLLAGYFVHRVWVAHFIHVAEMRRSAVRRLLPHAIESLAMIMNSGGTFLYGVEQLIEDFPKHPLSQEFARLKNSIERGHGMQDSLAVVARSICLSEFDEVIRVLTHVHGHGVPGAASFKRLAQHLRMCQLRQMEEHVGRSESKLSMPTIVVLLSCMLVCVAPFVLPSIINATSN